MMTPEECWERLTSLADPDKPRAGELAGDQEAAAWAVSEIERLRSIVAQPPPPKRGRPKSS